MSKRRRFTPHFKAQVVLKDLTGAKSTAEICREYQLRPQLLSRWKAEFLTRAPEIFATEQSRSEELQHIAELERMFGRLTMELEAARNPSSILTSLLARNGT
jgi:transposase-like protein